MGVSRKPLPQPYILMFVEQIRQTGHLLWKGGLADQPYIFMIEYKMAYDKKVLNEIAIKAIRESGKTK